MFWLTYLKYCLVRLMFSSSNITFLSLQLWIYCHIGSVYHNPAKGVKHSICTNARMGVYCSLFLKLHRKEGASCRAALYIVSAKRGSSWKALPRSRRRRRSGPGWADIHAGVGQSVCNAVPEGILPQLAQKGSSAAQRRIGQRQRGGTAAHPGPERLRRRERGSGGALPCRIRSADLLYSAGQLGEGWAADAGTLALSSACLVDSPCRFTHLSALDTAHASGVPVCFVPALRPALWPSEKTLRDTVLQFLPFADLLVLTEDEMELLLDTRAYQVGLFFLLQGHVQLVLLQTAEGVHAFTRAAHAFWPGLSAPPEELAARLLFRLDAQDAALKKLMKYSAAALQTLL